MNYPKRILAIAVIAIACISFAGCQPKKAESPDPSPLTRMSPPPIEIAENIQVQQEVCSKLPSPAVTQATGVAVGAPAVVTINSTSGLTRYICTYARDNDLSIPVLYVTVAYKQEMSKYEYEQLWQGQTAGSTVYEGLGTTSFVDDAADETTLYILTDDAQYSLKLGTLNQAKAKQLESLKKVAELLLKKS